VSVTLAKLSTIEIANKQRHVFLLQKVKENKALSRAELDELKRYERETAGKIIAKASMPSTRPSSKSSAKPSAKRVKKKAGKKKSKKKRKARPPVDEAEVRRLGLECENLTEADAAIRTRQSLSEIFVKHPQIRQAWDRGRFLRNLRGLARTGASVTEAAKKMGLVNRQVLRSMIDEDEEVGDLWDQTQLEVYIEIKSALIDAAKEGKADAVRAVESFLLEEKERPGFDPSRITIIQLIELTGKHRTTIHEWHTKFGLPRNADKTFDLGIFFSWHEDFLRKRVSEKESAAVPAVLDPLKAMKAEKLKLELASHRNELLDRSEVIIGQVAWVQNIVTFCERGIEEISRLCLGQPREKVAEIARGFFRDLHTEAAKVPKEVRLPAAMEKELIEFLQRLKPHDDR